MQSIYLSISSSIHPSIHPSISPSIYIYLSTYLSLCISLSPAEKGGKVNPCPHRVIIFNTSPWFLGSFHLLQLRWSPQFTVRKRISSIRYRLFMSILVDNLLPLLPTTITSPGRERRGVAVSLLIGLLHADAILMMLPPLLSTSHSFLCLFCLSLSPT